MKSPGLFALVTAALLLPVPSAPAGALPVPLAVPGVSLSVASSGFAFSSAYVEAGDLVWVNVTVANGGLTAANASVEMLVGDGPPVVFASLAVNVGGGSTAVASARLDTSGLVGIETVTLRIIDSSPGESGPLTDNEASAPLRVHHAIVDQVWQGNQVGSINTTYPFTGFVTVRDNASLTIGPAGLLIFEQLRNDQFDILVEGNGLLRVTGGEVFSNFSLSVELQGAGSLVVERGALFNASVRSTSTGAVVVDGAAVNAASFDLEGGSLALTGAQLNAGRVALGDAAVTVAGSAVASMEPVALGGASGAAFRDSTLRVESHFDNAPSAEAVFPGITGALSQGQGPFQPAVALSGTATAEFRGTSAVSLVWVGAVSVSSTTPLLAGGASSGTLYRTARVLVTDPTGAPVPNASVEVRHRINSTLVASALAANGSVDIELPSTVLLSGAALMVGQYKVTAWRASTTSDEVPFNFPLYPELSPASLVQVVPVALALKLPGGLYGEPPLLINVTPTVVSDLVLNRSVEISVPLLLGGHNLTLLQSRPFERYILLTDNGTLGAQGALIRSDYPFNLYLINGSRLHLENSAVLGGNLLLTSAGDLTLTNSRIVGSVIGDAARLDCTGSFVWSRLFDLQVGSVAATDCVFAGSQLVALRSTGLAQLSSVGLGTTYEPIDAANRSSLSASEYDAAAQGGVGASGAPSVRLSAAGLDLGPATVWTSRTFALELGPDNSTLAGPRILAGAVTFSLTAANVTVDHGTFDPSAALSFTGTGQAVLRGDDSAPPTAAPGVTLDIFEPVTVRVLDALGLPAAGAAVVAVPQAAGGRTETATSGPQGAAEVLLLVSHTEGGATTPGPLYRINATRAGSSSATITWDATQADSFALTLGEIFGQASAQGSFALVTRLASGVWRLLATNLPNASLAVFLTSFGAALGPLNFTAPVFPGEDATVYVAADYDFEAGGEHASLPIAGEAGTVRMAGAVVGSFVQGPDGLGTASFSLPANPGLFDVLVSVGASRLPGPLDMSGSFSLTPRAKLVILASVAKRTFKPAEQVSLVGVVKDDAGRPIAGATVTLETSSGAAPRTNRTNVDGSFLFRLLAPTVVGNYDLRLTASFAGSVDSDTVAFPYEVSTQVVAPPSSHGPTINLFALLLAIVIALGGGLGLVYAWTQWRVGRGEFVVCGRCEKPTLATDRKCRNCGVEFEVTVAKCSKCGSWIQPDASQCPQCKTKFSTSVVREEREQGPTIPEPSAGVPAGFDIPESIPLTARRADGGRLEDMEFRLPGTTDTLDLGEKGSAPTFGAAGPSAATRAPPSRPSADRPLERMELPRHEEADSPVREVSALEGGEPTRREPVSLGTANLDLSRTTAAATSTKPDPTPDEEIPEDVLRELLMKAAPELGGDVLPGEIRKELQEIARSEAPVASEKRAASSPKSERPAGGLSPEERPAEAPEKSRKTAFDVFSKPAKNIPVGYEKKGAPPGKDAGAKAAPVCPNCGGNWVVQRDGKNSCRVCGTRW